MRILLHPRMQSKLCLVLALVVLLGALAFGNPFRGDGPAVSLRSGAGDVSGAPNASPASERAVVNASLAANLPAKRAAGLEDAAMPGAQVASLPSGPVPAVQRGDLRSEFGAKRSKRPPAVAVEPKEAAAAEVCPDAALQPLVVRVRKGSDGQPIWVLRDGRQVRRNPKTGPGEPLVVPVVVPAGAGVGQAEHADEGADR